MSNKMTAFKNEICDRYLLPIEDRIREFWPNQQPKVTLLVRTPWLADGGLLITNDSIDEARKEIDRLREKNSCAEVGYPQTERRTALEGVPFYVASRASIPERGKMWRTLRLKGLNIVSSWIDEDGEGETKSFEDLWLRIEVEIRSAVALVLYVEPSDFPLKGALVEVGMAIAMGKPVLVFAPGVQINRRDFKPLGSWAKHPGVMLMTSGVETLLETTNLLAGRDPSHRDSPEQIRRRQKRGASTPTATEE